MYKKLIEQGFGIEQIDEWDIHFFFSVMEFDEENLENQPHGFIDDIAW